RDLIGPSTPSPLAGSARQKVWITGSSPVMTTFKTGQPFTRSVGLQPTDLIRGHPCVAARARPDSVMPGTRRGMTNTRDCIIGMQLTLGGGIGPGVSRQRLAQRLFFGMV